MPQKQLIKRLLVISLGLISLGGWMLHLRIHPPAINPTNWIPFYAGIISVFLIPMLFLNSRTIHWAYILNGMTVIIGTITMAHFSIERLTFPMSLSDWLLKTTLPDIFILWVKFFIGLAIFELHVLRSLEQAIRKGRIWHYPNWGWWGVHFASMSFIYILGHLLWK